MFDQRSQNKGHVRCQRTAKTWITEWAVAICMYICICMYIYIYISQGPLQAQSASWSLGSIWRKPCTSSQNSHVCFREGTLRSPMMQQADKSMTSLMMTFIINKEQAHELLQHRSFAGHPPSSPYFGHIKKDVSVPHFLGRKALSDLYEHCRDFWEGGGVSHSGRHWPQTCSLCGFSCHSSFKWSLQELRCSAAGAVNLVP